MLTSRRGLGIRFELETGARATETFVNPYVEKLLGYGMDEWLSKPDFALSIIHAEDQSRVADETAAVIARGDEGVLQFRWLTKNGDVLWVESHLTAICDENGKAVGLRGVTMNITDRRQAETALQKTRPSWPESSDRRWMPSSRLMSDNAWCSLMPPPKKCSAVPRAKPSASH